MKLHLVAPSRIRDVPLENRIEKGDKALFPPSGLMAVAALTPPEFEVQLTDESVEEIDFNGEADIIGITASTAQAPRAYDIADEFRRKGKTVVLGGIHPTALPEEAIEHADSVVVGEAEGKWQQLLEDWSQGRLRPFYRSEEFPCLKNLPWSRRDLLKTDAYYTTGMIQSTRGCPFNCTFCAVSKIFGRKYRVRPVQEVMAEVASLKDKIVVFVDDNIVGNLSYGRKLFSALASLGKKWLGQWSVSAVKDEGLLKAAAKSGCRAILMGMESLSPENLKAVGKTFNIAQRYREVIKKLHDFGIAVIGSFMFGLDADTEATFDTTLEFAEKAKIDALQFSILTPFPGTRLYQQLKAEKRIIEWDWSKYDGTHVVFLPHLLSPEKLQEGFQYALRQAYSLSCIFKRLFRWHTHLPLLAQINLAFHRRIKAFIARTTLSGVN